MVSVERSLVAARRACATPGLVMLSCVLNLELVRCIHTAFSAACERGRHAKQWKASTRSGRNEPRCVRLQPIPGSQNGEELGDLPNFAARTVRRLNGHVAPCAYHRSFPVLRVGLTRN